MPDKKRTLKKMGYIITLIVAILVMLFLEGSIALSATFLPFASFTAVYVMLAGVALVIGFLCALVLRKLAATDKSFLIGNMLISVICALFITVTLLLQMLVARQVAAYPPGEAGVDIATLFGAVPDPLLSGAIILVLFNIAPVIIFFGKEKKSLKDLLVYGYGVAIFLMGYVAVSRFFVV